MVATINGERRELPERATVADLLEELALDCKGIAVAVNEHVVRGASFDEAELREGDVVEIIRAVPGG